MSSNPFQTPSPGPGFSGQGPSNVDGKVKGPAIAMLVVMGISMVFQILSLILNMLGMGLGVAGAAGAGQANSPEAIGNLVGGGIGMAFGVLSIFIGGFIIYGCTKMMKLESYQTAYAAMIIGMLPCISPCCLLGLPFGIWGLVVLNDPLVKSSFRS